LRTLRAFLTLTTPPSRTQETSSSPTAPWNKVPPFAQLIILYLHHYQSRVFITSIIPMLGFFWIYPLLLMLITKFASYIALLESEMYHCMWFSLSKCVSVLCLCLYFRYSSNGLQSFIPLGTPKSLKRSLHVYLSWRIVALRKNKCHFLQRERYSS